MLLEPAPRTVRGARDLISVALQYGNAFGQGMQAAALKPADFFGNDDVLYLMEDMATGEIRLSILWEWLHKNARLTDGERDSGAGAGDQFTLGSVRALLAEEYEKLRKAGNRDVHDNSKDTTLPIAREIVEHLRRRTHQAAVVHRPAEHQSGCPRSRGSARGESRAARRRFASRRHARDREPRLPVITQAPGVRRIAPVPWACGVSRQSRACGVSRQSRGRAAYRASPVAQAFSPVVP